MMSESECEATTEGVGTKERQTPWKLHSMDVGRAKKKTKNKNKRDGAR